MAEEDEAFDPVGLRSFGADAVMKSADVVTHLVEKLRHP